MWLQDESIKERMQQWWQDHHFTGNPGYVFCKKLQAVKGDLRDWNLQTFGRVNRIRDELLVQIKAFDEREAQGVSTVEDSFERVNKKADYLKWAKLESIRMKQKTKNQWIIEGDHNTSFFHRYANNRRRANTIGSIRVDGDVTEEQSVIASHIQDFYINLYKEDRSNRPFVEDLEFSAISVEESTNLEKRITDEEVKQGMHEMKSNKTQ
ncbi:uncharacterized protein LOC113316654 [Papaver somniferum]|uniref:uncharacterized protein LOC113316654 n=1 Tax=Papaver somniferum TaxID=3469 RepID=UPI000E6FF75B|nr:uncharacterized protein LOC113316654 [Papaver somniferum]